MLRRFTRIPSVASVVSSTQVCFQRGGRGGQQQPPVPQMEEQPPAPEPPKKPEGEPQFLKMTTDDKGILTIKMKRSPVNSMSYEFFKEMNEWLLWLGSDESTKAIIITSELPHVFSAGLDINELHKPTPERFGQFWTQFQENWMMLNTFPKPIVASINGNSPAGGCVMAIGCDYRVMAKAPADRPDVPYRIGLNETKLGIVAPPWVMATFSYVVGQRKAERMLQLGETPTAEEAGKIGLVDEVVEATELEAAAQRAAERFAAIPTEARWMSKDMMRRELFQNMSTEEERQYDTEFFTQMIQNPEVTKNVGNYLERLSKAKSKK